MNTRIAPFFIIAIIASLVSVAQAQILNGDFEQGNTGFTSGYGYVAPSGQNLYPAGLYTVGNRGNVAHPAFSNLSDSPSVAGNLFFIANGDTTPGTIVWQQSNVNVAANSNIFFNMDLANLVSTAPAALQFYIRRPTISNDFVAFGSVFSNTKAATGAASDWETFSASFATGANETSVDLFVVNQTTAAGGNDFAMDDLRLTSQAIGTNVTMVPEANSAALLGLALPMIGLVAGCNRVAVVRRRTGQNEVSSQKATLSGKK